MKHITNLTLLILLTILLFSCKEEEGRWKDNIKLSTKTVNFGALSDSVTVTTGSGGWWISDITLNGEHYYDFAGINLQADSYVIKQGDFVVERQNKNTLFIKVSANPLNVQRILTVGLQNGDYFDRITITQKVNQ